MKNIKCGKCGSTNVVMLLNVCICEDCDHSWDYAPSEHYLEEGHDIEMGGGSVDVLEDGTGI